MRDPLNLISLSLGKKQGAKSQETDLIPFAIPPASELYLLTTPQEVKGLLRYKVRKLVVQNYALQYIQSLQKAIHLAIS